MLSLPTLVTQVALKPLEFVQALDTLLSQLNQVATRAIALLDVAEPIAARVSTVAADAEKTAQRVTDLVTRAEGVAGRVDDVVGRAQGIAGDVDALTGQAAGIATKADAATQSATDTVAAVQPLVEAVKALDPQALVALVETIPAVLEKLAAQVDHLDQTVAEVGALLSGIPGAARLAKRGDRLTAR